MQNLGASVVPFEPGRHSDRLVPLLLDEHSMRVDFNGDGDKSDQVLGIYDAAADRTDTLGVAFDSTYADASYPVALWAGLMVFTGSEYDQGVDLNGDGDLCDQHVVHVWDADRRRLINTRLTLSASGVVYDDVGAGEGGVVFVVREYDNGDLNGDGDDSDEIALGYGERSGVLRLLGDYDSGGSEPRVHQRRLVGNMRERDVGDQNADGDALDLIPVSYDLDTGARRLLPIAGVLAAISDRTVGLFVSEARDGGRDWNGDGDSLDDVFLLYDPLTGATTVLKPAVPANLLIEDDWVIFAVDERADGRQDHNGDGDTDDAVLFLHDRVRQRTTNLGLAVAGTEPASFDGQVLFHVSEAANGRDLNGDGDALDIVIHHLDVQSTTVRNLGVAGTVAPADSPWFALEVREMDRGQDLNGDGDSLDHVFHVFDATTGTLHNMGIAAFHHRRPSSAGRILIDVHEPSQNGSDFNGDGDASDSVIHLVDLAARQIVNLGLASHEQTVLGRHVFAVSVFERDQGRDLNGDGDLFDVVPHVARLFDLEWSFNGPAVPGGAPVSFTARSAPIEANHGGIVLLSLGDGSSSGGIPLPGGRTLGLDPDSLFVLWSQLPPPFFRTPLNGCPGATTAALQIPPQVPSGLRIFYAGVSIAPGARISAVSETREFGIQ